MGEPGVAHISSIMGCPGIIFTDTEYATLQNRLAFPFADRICTPTAYQDEIGDTQIWYAGYHELAYLHPNHFEPDPTVLGELELAPDDSFAIIRLNAFNAAHFRGDSGFTNTYELIEYMEAIGTRPIISSEPTRPDDLAEYQATVPNDKMHDLMYFADIFVGESATMAAESAVLGTPAIFVSTSRRGYTDELSDRYGLVFTFSGVDRQEAAIEKTKSILEAYEPETWQRRRERLLNDKIDTTEFIIEQIDAVTR